MAQSQLVWLPLLEVDSAKAKQYLEMGLLLRICMVEAVKVVKTVVPLNWLLVAKESTMLTVALLLVQIRAMNVFHMVPSKILESQPSLVLALVDMAAAGKETILVLLLLVLHQIGGQAKHKEEGESPLAVRMVRDTTTRNLTMLSILLRFQVAMLLQIQALGEDHHPDLPLPTKLQVQQLVHQQPPTDLSLLPLQQHLPLDIHILNQLILSPQEPPSKSQSLHQ